MRFRPVRNCMLSLSLILTIPTMQLEGATIARAVRDRGLRQGIEQPDHPQMIHIIGGDQPHLNVTTRRARRVLVPRRLNKYKARSPTPRRRRDSVSTDDECVNCGNEHGQDGWCPANNKQCHACGRRGHFAFKCRDRQ